MQGAQKFFAWAYVVLTLLCAIGTGWMISVLGLDGFSCLMFVVFVAAFGWSVVQLRNLYKQQ